MSHLSKVKMRIDDLDALDEACQELGLELRRDQKTYATYAGQKHACDAAIVLPDKARAYEIGVVKVQGTDGQEYELAFDDWASGKGMMATVGPKCGKLCQEYGRSKTKRIAAAKGWSYREERQDNGSYRCYCAPRQKAWAGAGAKKSW